MYPEVMMLNKSSCEHNSKKRLEGVCAKCSEEVLYRQFKWCENKSCLKDSSCKHGGYFDVTGNQVIPTYTHQVKYSSEYIHSVYDGNAYNVDLRKLYQGQPVNWSCDQRTIDLFCLAQFLMYELIKLGASNDDRKDVQFFFNRKARAEDDLYALAAEAINSYLEGRIERFHRR